LITLQDIFVARPPDESSNGSRRGGELLEPLRCVGLKPHFLEKLATNNVLVAPNFFESEQKLPAGVRPGFAAAAFGGKKG
jgi:hypothetical protein